MFHVKQAHKDKSPVFHVKHQETNKKFHVKHHLLLGCVFHVKLL